MTDVLPNNSLIFLKGPDDILKPGPNKPIKPDDFMGKIREHLTEAMNAKHVSFLFGSGCSSFLDNTGNELGISTMGALAKEFIEKAGTARDLGYINAGEKKKLIETLGFDLSTSSAYVNNLERFMEALFSYRLAYSQSQKNDHKALTNIIEDVIKKTQMYIVNKCTQGVFTQGDTKVIDLYKTFYRNLVYRDRALPRPWVFTLNYDLFNEQAMDNLGLPYMNGFTGVVERRFNPASFRYSLAEQLDLTSRKWSAVDGFVYLCKLHGSVNWVEDNHGLFPIRELQTPDMKMHGRVMIYPTPAKQNASLSSPYSDLFREFHSRIVREQSVLFVIGYSFGDEHINNIIYQALTVPTFRLVLFASPTAQGEVQKLRELGDPRIWIIGGDLPDSRTKAHYFEAFVSHFMPEPPGDKIDQAVQKVVKVLMGRNTSLQQEGTSLDGR